MDLALSQSQEQLRVEMAARLASRCEPSAVMTVSDMEPGYDRSLWAEVIERGWPAAALESATDSVVCAEEFGRAAAPSPWHNGLVQSGLALAALGDESRLASLVAGERRFAFCWIEPCGSYQPAGVRASAHRDGGSWVLDGVKCFVPYAASADCLLVVTRVQPTDGLDTFTLFAVDADSPGLTRRHIPTIGRDRQCEVVLDRVRVPDSAVVGQPGWQWPLLQRALRPAVVALAADMVGAARGALDCAVARVSTRHQWGVPIGSLQAVQHRCADMLIDVTTAEDAVFDAAGIIDRGEDARLAVSTAKALCNDACRRVSAGAHQVHGGEGIYADRGVHLWYRRIKAAEPMLGDTRHHRAVVASLLLGEPAGA